jgi:hypothetical protein
MGGLDFGKFGGMRDGLRLGDAWGVGFAIGCGGGEASKPTERKE